MLGPRAWWRERRRAAAQVVEEEVLRFVVGGILTGVVVGIAWFFDELDPWLTRAWRVSSFTLLVGGLLLVLLGGGILYLLLRPRLSRLRDLAAKDDLTGLYNSREFQHRLEVEVERADRYHHDLSLILIDVDQFKVVNAEWGYQTGDLVLQEIAQFLQSEVRASDQVFRYRFGDEFAILVPETDGVGARTMSERLRSIVENYRFQSVDGDTQIDVTISAGVAEWEADEASTELQERAEAALATSKDRGNTVTLDA